MPPPLGQRPSSLRVSEWTFATSPVGPMRAAVMVPTGLAQGERLPLLIAMHGQGEALRGVERGVHGWDRDYELGASDHVLRHRPLATEGFLGFVSPTRLRALRADLARRPYRGMIVVAPYTPDILIGDAGVRAAPFESWLVDTLLPRARRELPVLQAPAATGIDGVSLGGLHALLIGLSHPEAFGVVGALQPALRNRVPEVLARLAPSRPTQRLRLVTSTHDFFRRDVQALSAALTTRGIPHDVRVVEGPHDYVFNRGPGGIEMLLFHDRALRAEPAE